MIVLYSESPRFSKDNLGSKFCFKISQLTKLYILYYYSQCKFVHANTPQAQG